MARFSFHRPHYSGLFFPFFFHVPFSLVIIPYPGDCLDPEDRYVWNEYEGTAGRMIIRPYQGKSPVIHPEAWIAENAVIIGDVEIGPQANIWYNVVIRGDLHRIRIGARTNIQDGAILHVEAEEGPCNIGEGVTVGHQAIVHGCQVGDHALIGMGASILSWSRIGAGALIAAGALVLERSDIPERTLWAGVPARFRREVDEETLQRMEEGCDHYLKLAAEYRRQDAALHHH